MHSAAHEHTSARRDRHPHARTRNSADYARAPKRAQAGANSSAQRHTARRVAAMY